MTDLVGLQIADPIKIGLVNIYQGIDTEILHHTYVQNTPATVWMFEHDLGYDPAGIVVLDDSGNRHHPLVSYPSPDLTIRLDFDVPVQGTCRLS